MSGLSGLAIADFVDENAAVHVDVPIQTYDKQYTQVQIEHMVSFSKKMWVFGIKRRDLDNKAAELKRSIARKREKLCAEQLDNGFESTSYSHTGYAKSTTITTSGGDSLGSFDRLFVELKSFLIDLEAEMANRAQALCAA